MEMVCDRRGVFGFWGRYCMGFWYIYFIGTTLLVGVYMV